jgi:hypothetical protein
MVAEVIVGIDVSAETLDVAVEVAGRNVSTTLRHHDIGFSVAPLASI